MESVLIKKKEKTREIFEEDGFISKLSISKIELSGSISLNTNLSVFSLFSPYYYYGRL